MDAGAVGYDRMGDAIGEVGFTNDLHAVIDRQPEHGARARKRTLRWAAICRHQALGCPIS